MYFCSSPRDEKSPRTVLPAGAETPAPPAAGVGRTSVLLVAGARISEETIRRRLATYEPFSFTQEPDDEK